MTIYLTHTISRLEITITLENIACNMNWVDSLRKVAE